MDPPKQFVNPGDLTLSTAIGHTSSADKILEALDNQAPVADMFEENAEAQETAEPLSNQAPNTDISEQNAETEETAEPLGNQAPNTEIFDQNAEALRDIVLDTSIELTTAFVVTEIWLPIPQEDYRDRLSCCGVKVLAVFRTVAQANEYARRHIQNLEALTKAERKEEGEDKGRDVLIPNEADPFSGRYQKTLPLCTFPDGTQHFRVYWGNDRTTTVRVDERLVHDYAEVVPLFTPIHEADVDNFRWHDGSNRIAEQH